MSAPGRSQALIPEPLGGEGTPVSDATGPAPEASRLDTALVVACHGRHLMIERPDRTRLHAHLRGKRNDAVVGDHVHWRASGDGAVVEGVLERRNLLFRQDEWRIKSFAANLDQVVLVLAVEPVFSERLLARSLVAAGHADIPVVVVLNKSDLPGLDLALQRLSSYRAMGLPVTVCSLGARPQQAREQLAPLLDQRTSLLLGPSGSGKSTLVNLVVPEARAQVGEISRALASGRHTTTSTTWYWLGGSAQGALIDSPGFQEFGLHQVAASDLAGLMPDLQRHEGHCRFSNCSHRAEPECSVRAAVDSGQLPAQRYRLYLEFHEELSAAAHHRG